MTVDLAVFIVATVVVIFLVGATAGAFVAIAVYDRAQERLARFGRTGHVKESKPGEPRLPDGELRDAVTTSPERQAQERAYANVVERGAEEFMKVEPRLTPEEARAKARAAIAELGAFAPMGGIPGA